jgi:hypothetical protein
MKTDKSELEAKNEQLDIPVVMLSLAFLFAQWLGEKQYTKHQVNDRWYDDGYFIGSTEDMWKLFQTDVDWVEHKKDNGA